jgi:murein DD-endopeptidase MepM/ murein hydrolase activator NlpD
LSAVTKFSLKKTSKVFNVDSLGLAKHKKVKSHRKKRKTLATVGSVLGLAATFLFPFEKSGNYVEASFLPYSDSETEELGAFPIPIPTLKWGFAIDTLEVTETKVRRNETLGSLLSDYLYVTEIEKLVKNCEGVFDLTKDFISGKNYALLTRMGEENPDYLVLEPNVYEYVVFNLTGDLAVNKVKREIEVKTQSVSGAIQSSLWETLTDLGVNMEAAAKMEDALQYSVDFSRTQEGDEFKLVYDENFIHDKSVGAGEVYAAYYKRNGKEHYAFWYDDGTHKGYFDEEGRPAAKGFLKAPVKYSRISSKYNLRRFHPVLKHVRPHLGTDYAAPHGTPIIAVGSGVVEEAAYTRGNGKYVKIKHDKVYQTQYLHMSRFAKGIRRGATVQQGQVIGYVGSTGLATGPHVCFRFWKNGRQVNHLKLNLPRPKQLPKDVLKEFFQVRDHYLAMLKGEPAYDLAEKEPDTFTLPDGSALPGASAP